MIQTSLFSISVFLAGVLSFFSPCILPLMPVYVGILLDSERVKTVRIFGRDISWYGLVKTLCFIAGLSTVFLILGYGAGALGQVLYAPWFRYLLGGIVILLGIHQMEVINLRQLQKQKTIQLKKNRERNEFFNAFLIGVTFSFGWTSFEFCFSHCSFWRRWCFTRRSPDAGIYIRLGSAFLAFGLGF